MNFYCVCNCANSTDLIRFGYVLAGIDTDEIGTELEHPWPRAGSISNQYIKNSDWFLMTKVNFVVQFNV